MGAALGRKKIATVLVLGLDNSGKTAVLDCLAKVCGHHSKSSVYVPGVGVRVQNIRVREYLIEMAMCELSGQHRDVWEKLYKDCDGIMYVLDSSDHLRLAVVKEELSLTLSNEDIEHKPVPILFLANKMDISNAIDSWDCMEALDLCSISDRRWQIYSTNALTGEGLKGAMAWFAIEVKKCLKHKKAPNWSIGDVARL